MLDPYPKRPDLFLSCYYWRIRIYLAITYSSILLVLTSIHLSVDETKIYHCTVHPSFVSLELFGGSW